MIQKGIITQLLLEENKVSVRIPIFETTGSQEVVFDCNIMIQPGMVTGYNVDDVVYVDFENNDYEHPVVVGKLYTGNNNVSQSAFLGNAINVNGKATFSSDFQVGDINYTDLYATVNELKLEKEANKLLDLKLYQHNIVMMSNDTQDYVLFNFINQISTAMDYSEVREWLYDNGFTGEYNDEYHYLKATGRCSADSFEYDYTPYGQSTTSDYCESVVVGVRATSEEDNEIKLLVNLLKEDDESTYEEDYTGMDYFTDTVVKLI